MTTIAYRDGVLAADTQIGNGWIAGATSKFWYRQNCLVTGAGNASEVQTAARKILAANPCITHPQIDAWEVKVDESTVVVFLTHHEDRERVRVIEFQKGGWFEQKPFAFNAWGSGSPAAMGAMMAGADAPTAVTIATELDPDSGGDVETITLDAVRAAEPEGGE
jgi:hypothetical protein